MRSRILLLAAVLLCGPLGMTSARGPQRLFAYEPGKCALTITEVFEAMFKTEVGLLIGARARLSQSHLLHYDLYTPLNPQKRQFLRAGDLGMLRKSHFNPEWPVRISIHGWSGRSESCSNAAIKDAYLSRGNYNVIILDWSRQAMDISYQRVSTQLSSIAANVAKMLRFLHDSTGVPYEQIYLVGHSAGSHISGLAGKHLRPQLLGAIIALDPAGLTQLSLGPEDRLSPHDAMYVESIHTDLTLLGNPSDLLSHASFFVNWGLGQPHCPNATAAEFAFVCDHFAALYYFAESIRRPRLFPALRCDSGAAIHSATCHCRNSTSSNSTSSSIHAMRQTCHGDQFMGGEPAVQKNGVYYLSTRRQAPYGHIDGMVHMKPPVKSNVFETGGPRFWPQ
ncbi:GL12219 [Drosophila persimilis]|uniref:Lipase member H isoform X1 n=2 Tax=pseudoobscura subgroup TaxID=32358 RepID=A0A6I8URE3_DROPS|nr:lipase member H isoform X1 [Drosophila pseudoobscura]XP_002019449.1 lipase member H [Drosophila persimilis]EDW38083.1 GL12219 [Drosophila persimilis]